MKVKETIFELVAIAVIVLWITGEAVLISRVDKLVKTVTELEARIESLETKLEEHSMQCRKDILDQPHPAIPTQQEPEQETPKSKIPSDCPYISEIERACENYDFVEDLPVLIYAMMKAESNFDPNCLSSAKCVGLMQVSPYWHSERATKLGVTDLWDPYGNILVAVDLLQDLYLNYAHEEIVLAVMMYNMGFDTAKRIYANGQWSMYATEIFERYDAIVNEKG